MFNTANSYTLSVPETAAYLESVKQPNFPPYNIVKRDGKYLMEMAVAGYSKSSIKVFVKEGTLNINSSGVDTTTIQNVILIITKKMSVIAMITIVL